MNPRGTVIEALRRFLPKMLESNPALTAEQKRAIWAITHCRTAMMGGHAYDCKACGRVHFAWHSCNHKACPQCGATEIRQWVKRELNKRVEAPYYLVTFTLPSEIRGCFFGPHSREAYDLFFNAAAKALARRLEEDEKGMQASVSGFTAVLHTWNQKLQFHPHLHFLVPGAGLDCAGKAVRVKYPGFLVVLAKLQAAFRKEMRKELEANQWEVDPKVWDLDWGVHIRAVGSGIQAIKYLGTYVAKTAIKDARILSVNDKSVRFLWRDRSDKSRMKPMELSGVEFVRLYLNHVLPGGLRSVRHYGFCHPTAKAKRMKVKFGTGEKVELGAMADGEEARENVEVWPRCPVCGGEMTKLHRIDPGYKTRGPPLKQRGTTKVAACESKSE